MLSFYIRACECSPPRAHAHQELATPTGPVQLCSSEFYAPSPADKLNKIFTVTNADIFNRRILKTAKVGALASVASDRRRWERRRSRDHFWVLKHSKLKEPSPASGEAFTQRSFSHLAQRGRHAPNESQKNIKIKPLWDCFWIVHHQNISEELIVTKCTLC